jgi:hypothetical protein
MSPRRNVNPATCRQTIAALSLALALLLAMVVAAIALVPSGRVRVPELLGLTKRAIVVKAQHLHLRPVFTDRYDNARRGLAIRQDPRPGVWVREGSVMRIVLSEGPPPVEVPRLIGEPSTNARSILGSLGLGVSVSTVPAPGAQAGVVTGQSPAAGAYLPPHARVALSVAETPRWRPLISIVGTAGASSVPFRIRGKQWRIVYRMAYVGTCALIIFCDGPTAHVIQLSTGSTSAKFDLNDGDPQTRIVQSGSGLYQIKVTPGSDTARWSLAVQDYY